MGHIENQIRNPELETDNTLHVIGVISNPARWHSRYRLFRQWRDEMLRTPGVKLYVVEGVYGDHQGECAPECGQDYQYLKVKLSTEAWLKENMINVGVKNLFPPGWKYMAWVDCDVHFRDPSWPQATLRALQTYNLVQPWSHGIALGPNGGVMSVDTSFGYLSTTGKKMSWGHHQSKDGYQYAHTGYAWACTRYFWENIEKLVDFCLIGSADHHMAWLIKDKAQETIHGQMSQGYKDLCVAWGEKAIRATSGMVGFVSGRVEHHFHGPKRGRNYIGRWNILLNMGYNPKTDIAYDAQGMIYLIGPRKMYLEGAIMAYNRARLEDSIEET